jgi:hypothetical protein
MRDTGLYLITNNVIVKETKGSPPFEVYLVPEKYRGLFSNGQQVEFKIKRTGNQKLATSIEPYGSTEKSGMLSSTEAGKLLGVSAGRLRYWEENGNLPFPVYRIGTRGDRRFRLEDIRAYLESVKK